MSGPIAREHAVSTISKFVRWRLFERKSLKPAFDDQLKGSLEASLMADDVMEIAGVMFRDGRHSVEACQVDLLLLIETEQLALFGQARTDRIGIALTKRLAAKMRILI